jgi:hypothetical protein
MVIPGGSISTQRVIFIVGFCKERLILETSVNLTVNFRRSFQC